MAGDNWIKFSSYLDAAVYSKAGAEVFLYFYDVDGLGDFIANTKDSCCGLGHAKELLYTWGTAYNQYIFSFMAMASHPQRNGGKHKQRNTTSKLANTLHLWCQPKVAIEGMR